MATESDTSMHAGNDAQARLGLFGAMRIRKKLIILHTTFSVVLGAVLLITLRPGASAVIARAESSQAIAVLSILDREGWFEGVFETEDELPSRIGDDDDLTRSGLDQDLGVSQSTVVLHGTCHQRHPAGDHAECMDPAPLRGE